MGGQHFDLAPGQSPFEPFLSLLHDVQRRNGTAAQARCPGHSDPKASLSITVAEDRVLLHCHAGCSPEAVVAAVGLELKDLFNGLPNGTAKDSARKLIATYDYRDAQGELVYQVCRFSPKSFRQRRPDGHGGWKWNLEGVEALLYRLPELNAADPHEWVIIPEGEKDVDNLALKGFVATTNSGGAGKFKPELARYLRGRRVVVWPDNDQPGRVHADKIAAVLAAVAGEVRIITPPAAVTDKGDVSDLLAADWGHEEIIRVIERAPTYQARLATPIIVENDDQYPAIAAAAWKALQRGNSPPRLFLHNNIPTRLEDDGRRVMIDSHRLRDELATTAQWFDAKLRPSRPSVDLANLMLAGRAIPLPRVRRFATAPLFTRDGRLISKAGFDERSGIYLLTQVDIEVPETPDDDDVARAVALLDEFIEGFPFASPADRAGAFALMLERAAREMMEGVPGHLVSASIPGSGKGKLIKRIFDIHGITPAAWVETPRGDDAEIRKAITSFLMGGRSHLRRQYHPPLDERRLGVRANRTTLARPDSDNEHLCGHRSSVLMGLYCEQPRTQY